MKSWLLFLCLLLSFHVQAKDLTWSYGQIQFQGERQLVLGVVATLEKIHRTDVGERLMSYFKVTRPHFTLLGGEGELSFIDVNDLLVAGSEYSPLIVYKLLSATFEAEHPGGHPLIDSALFTYQLQQSLALEIEARDFMILKGESSHLEKILLALGEIEKTTVGVKLMQDMKACGKKLTIVDDKSSLSGGGFAGAIRSSSGIFEGRGEDARIRFRFDQPPSGSHLVYTTDHKQIAFTYLDNLYHELVHAKHIMCGTMSRFYSEHQAIAEENQFRFERQRGEGSWERDPSRYEEGVQVWFGLNLDP